MTRALLVIDIQEDYFPGGEMELVGPEAAAGQAARVIKHVRSSGDPVIYMQHISGENAGFFRPGTSGINIHPAVEPADGDTVIEKHFPNSFHETRLQDHLTDLGVEELVITGMMSHMCVDATTRAARDLGYQCTVISDACACPELSYDGETVPAAQVHSAFMAALNGTYARVTKAGEWLAGA